ncbi:MAG: SirB2 family protein [Gammaproteobacteria bacterium]|nr:SirB2 family protein [Gammaproteobacteria bacterium]
MLIKFYPVLLTVHVSAVAVSISLFILRGIWMMQQSPMLARKWVRVAPHVSDTVLIASAGLLAAAIGQYPFVNDWLTAKFILMFLYIGFGYFAINHGHNRGSRIINGATAIVILVYIVSVAITHNPFPLTLLFY